MIMHGMHDGPPAIFFFHGPFMLLSSLFWLLLLGTLVWLLIRRFATPNRPPFPPFGVGQPPFPPGPPPFQPGPQPSALEILQRRYAMGEIDATTYEQMRERLQASERPAE